MLIVDDEPNVCFTLKLIFKGEGYTVSTAGSAKDGIKILKSDKRKFDVVLTDCTWSAKTRDWSWPAPPKE